MKQITEEQTDGAVADAIKGMTPASDDSTLLPEANDPPEMRQAKALARRYRLPFVNLLPQDGDSPIDYSLLSEIPVDLMVRNQFVPLRRENGKLHIAMADPTDLDRLDDLAGALRMRLVPHVATAGAIDVVLRKGDATQRVLQEAASCFPPARSAARCLHRGRSRASRSRPAVVPSRGGSGWHRKSPAPVVRCRTLERFSHVHPPVFPR